MVHGWRKKPICIINSSNDHQRGELDHSYLNLSINLQWLCMRKYSCLVLKNKNDRKRTQRELFCNPHHLHNLVILP